MLVTLVGITNFSNETQPAKVADSIAFPPFNTTSFNSLFLTYLQANIGIVAVFITQPLKEVVSILDMVFGIETFSNAVHPEKAELPIFLTPSCNITSVKLVLFLKASAGIF